MSDVMMQLGVFQFSIGTAAYQSLRRSTEWRWAAQERVGGEDALQFGGYGRDEITLAGVIYPFHRGGFRQLDALRVQADLGIPLPLIAGTGAVMGLWAVESLSEGQEVFALAGAPRRMDFDMRIRKYGGLGSLLRR